MSEPEEIRNAIIKSAEITNEDHGMLSAWLHLDYGGAGQGFGGYALYLPKSFDHHAINGPAGHYIWRVLEVAGVGKWSQLPGKTIRVRGTRGGISAIGHIVKDDWFCPQEDFARAAAEEEPRLPGSGRIAELKPRRMSGEFTLCVTRDHALNEPLQALFVRGQSLRIAKFEPDDSGMVTYTFEASP